MVYNRLIVVTAKQKFILINSSDCTFTTFVLLQSFLRVNPWLDLAVDRIPSRGDVRGLESLTLRIQCL